MIDICKMCEVVDEVDEKGLCSFCKDVERRFIEEEDEELLEEWNRMGFEVVSVKVMEV